MDNSLFQIGNAQVRRMLPFGDLLRGFTKISHRA